MSYLPSRPACDVLLVTGDDDLAADVGVVAESVGADLTRLARLDPDDPAQLRQCATARLVLAEIAADVPAGRGDVVRLASDQQGTADVDGELIRLPSARPRLLAVLATAVNPPTGAVVGVIGASGGVGVSSLAVAMATRAPGVLLDLDPVGPGLDALLGADGEGLRWADLAGLDSPLVTDDLAALLPGRGRLRWLSSRVHEPDPPSATARRAVVQACRAHRRLTVADLGRGHDPLVLADVDAMIVLAGPDVGGLVGVVRQLDRGSVGSRPLGVAMRQRPVAGRSTRNGLSPGEAREQLAGWSVEVIASVPQVRGLAAATDRGDLAAAAATGLGRAADSCLQWARSQLGGGRPADAPLGSGQVRSRGTGRTARRPR